MSWLRLLAGGAGVLGALVQACSYPHYAGPLRPADDQQTQMQVADDGTVTFVQDRLEISARPMTDEELDRRFLTQTATGPSAANPYTFAGTGADQFGQRPARFTVFLLRVKNYAYPKVRLDPARIVLRTSNGREYWSLGLEQLDAYFRAYAIGFRGNEYHRYQTQMDILARTMFPSQEVFSGQEVSGFVVFPALHPDVESLRLEVLAAHLRFDYRNEPVETARFAYAFVREIGQRTPRGVETTRQR